MGNKKQREGASRQSKTYEFHLAFKEVNGSVGKLVTGSTKVTQRFNRANQSKTPDVTAKAIDTPYSKTAHDNPYDARMSAIEQLLHKARSGDQIYIFTTDQCIKDIANDDPDVSSEVRKKFKAIAERDITIEVADPSVLEDQDYIEMADKMARIRVNNLSKPSSGLRSDHR